MGFLSGKRVLVVGLASNRSIAWGCAEAMHREGAEMAFTYQVDKLKSRVEDMAAETGTEIILPLDVSSDEQIEVVFEALGDRWGSLDVIVHSVGFVPREQLQGTYVDAVTPEGFAIAHDISSYSLAALAKAGRKLMHGRNGALITLSYLGAVRTVPNYNVMGVAKAGLEANVRYLADSLGPEGIRVNAISAGPICTLAACGISGFKGMLAEAEKKAPLRRNISIEEVSSQAAIASRSSAAPGRRRRLSAAGWRKRSMRPAMASMRFRLRSSSGGKCVHPISMSLSRLGSGSSTCTQRR
jgi:enoyl-[acyl-carrier protein] reductase I